MSAFVWRVKTLGRPYRITLSTKSSGVPPTSRNNKFLTFSALGALSFSRDGSQSTISDVRAWLHTATITALTRKNQYKQQGSRPYSISFDLRPASALLSPPSLFFLFLSFSSHTMIAYERTPLWRRCRRSATQRSPRRGTRLPMPISSSRRKQHSVDRRTVNAATPAEFDRYSRARDRLHARPRSSV